MTLYIHSLSHVHHLLFYSIFSFSMHTHAQSCSSTHSFPTPNSYIFSPCPQFMLFISQSPFLRCSYSMRIFNLPFSNASPRKFSPCLLMISCKEIEWLIITISIVSLLKVVCRKLTLCKDNKYACLSNCWESIMVQWSGNCSSADILVIFYQHRYLCSCSSYNWDRKENLKCKFNCMWRLGLLIVQNVV